MGCIGSKDVFTFTEEKDDDVRVMKFTHNGEPVTWRSFIALTKESNIAFVNVLKEAILSTSFNAMFFNCPPVTRDDLNQVFEAAIMNAPSLDGVTTDVKSFEDKFKGNDMVTSFENLRKDSLMVSPVPLEDQKEEIYSSLGPFIRNAPEEQQLAFWGAIGQELFQLIPKRTVWVNTAGTGVYFLHMRLDSKPKYYQYEKFMSSDYYRNDNS